MKKGELFESEQSKIVHKNNLAFLVSPKLLREYNLGQIDLAAISNKKIKIYEVKSSYYPSQLQMKRLKRTVDYLARIMEMDVVLEVRLCQKRDDSLFY
jgi:hypothetical protein